MNDKCKCCDKLLNDKAYYDFEYTYCSFECFKMSNEYMAIMELIKILNKYNNSDCEKIISKFEDSSNIAYVYKIKENI